MFSLFVICVVSFYLFLVGAEHDRETQKLNASSNRSSSYGSSSGFVKHKDEEDSKPKGWHWTRILKVDIDERIDSLK